MWYALPSMTTRRLVKRQNIGERGAGWVVLSNLYPDWLTARGPMADTYMTEEEAQMKVMAVQCKKKAAASKLKSLSPLGLLLIALVICYPRGTTSHLQVPLFLDKIHLPVGKGLWDRRKCPLQPHLS